MLEWLVHFKEIWLITLGGLLNEHKWLLLILGVVTFLLRSKWFRSLFVSNGNKLDKIPITADEYRALEKVDDNFVRALTSKIQISDMSEQDFSDYLHDKSGEFKQHGVDMQMMERSSRSGRSFFSSADANLDKDIITVSAFAFMSCKQDNTIRIMMMHLSEKQETPKNYKKVELANNGGLKGLLMYLWAGTEYEVISSVNELEANKIMAELKERVSLKVKLATMRIGVQQNFMVATSEAMENQFPILTADELARADSVCS